MMRRATAAMLVGQALLVLGLVVALRTGKLPRGVPGEWEWPRVAAGPGWWGGIVGLAGIGLYAAVAGWGMRSLDRSGGRLREGAWLATLVVAAVVGQALIQEGAPAGYGLTKWSFALHNPGSSGYYTVAKDEIRDPWGFLADYAGWARRQEVPRHAAHPPGLYVATAGLLRLLEAHPAWARAVAGALPESAAAGFREISHQEELRHRRILPAADRAALGLIGALTLLACAATVVPLYGLARGSGLEPSWAWAAAAPWPLVPSAVMFQPTADTAFPLLATAALALAVRGRPASAAGAGAVLAAGMAFTLAFLPVGFTVALVLLMTPAAPWRRRLGLIVATGLGFLAMTVAGWLAARANPFAIWWENVSGHARFYATFRRSYAPWLLADALELAAGLGLPATAWALAGLVGGRRELRAPWAAIATLALLALSGKNLSEVARLWLPWMPALLVASAAGLRRLGGGARSLTITAALIGLQTLALEATIQVVYPITVE